MNKNQIGKGISNVDKYIETMALLVGSLHMLIPIVKLIYIDFVVYLDMVQTVLICFLLLLVLMKIYTVNRQNGLSEIKLLIKNFFSRTQLLVSALYGLFLISVFVNFYTGELDSIECVQRYNYDLFVCLFILFPLSRYYFRNKLPMWIVKTWKSILVALGIGELIILYSVFSDHVIYIGSGSGIGMLEFNDTLQLSINIHPNIVGQYVGLFFLLSVIIVFVGEKLEKVIFLLLAFINLCILCLSNSRGSFFSCLCAIAYICFIGILKRSKECTKRKLVISIISVLIALIGMIVIRDGIFNLYNNCVLENNNTGYFDVIREINITSNNGRTVIWKGSLKLATSSFKNFMFGITPYNISRVLPKIINLNEVSHTHNQFLEVLTDTGFPALIIFVIFNIVLAICCIKNIISKYDKKNYIVILFIGIIIFLELANVMEPLLMFYNFLVGAVFIILSGYITESKIMNLSEV